MNYPQIKPTLNLDFSNTKTLDPRINFRRGTPGAYYDGKTYAKAEENLISYSEDFNDSETYWSEVRATLTGSQASPIDSTSAYELSQTSTGLAGVLLVNKGKIKLQIGKQYVSSVYVKASSSNYFAIAEEVSRNNPTGTVAFTYFNLSNSGEVMLSHENHIASIQNVGNQWYRCSIMFTAKIEEDYTVMFYLDSGSNQSIVKEPQNVEVGSSVYLWGAQLEQRDSVTSYTKTDGTPVTKYQPQLMFASPDQPRFDHDVLTGESKGLLIEESRTNLIEYSEDFANDYWAHPRADVYTNAIAPDGTSSASELVANVSASGGMSIYKQSVMATSSPFTVSCYFKKGDGNYAAIFTSDGSGSGANQYFDIFNGTVEGGTDYGTVSFNIDSASVQDAGNGWFRCSVTITTDATSTRSNFGPSFPTGDGSDISCTINETRGFLWGAQIEAGSFPTSYIKTSGAPSGTERSADNASITGENFSSWYRQDEGAIDIDFKYYHKYQANDTVLSLIGDNGYVNIYQFTSNPMLVVRAANNTTSFNAIVENPYIDGGINRKISFSYSAQGFATCLNAGDVISSDLAIHGHDTLYVGQNSAGVVINGHIKKLSYYPQRLTNEQLQQLTK